MPVMANLFHDGLRTVLGRTLFTLTNLCSLPDVNSFTSSCVKKKLAYFDVPVDQEWRKDVVLELLHLREHDLSPPGFTSDEIKTMLKDICTS